MHHLLQILQNNFPTNKIDDIWAGIKNKKGVKA